MEKEKFNKLNNTDLHNNNMKRIRSGRVSTVLVLIYNICEHINIKVITVLTKFVKDKEQVFNLQHFKQQWMSKQLSFNLSSIPFPTLDPICEVYLQHTPTSMQRLSVHRFMPSLLGLTEKALSGLPLLFVRKPGLLTHSWFEVLNALAITIMVA